MIVNPRILRKDIVSLLNSIDAQISEVEKAAKEAGIQPEEMRDTKGNWVMSPLLLAKVQAIAALVQLNASDKT